MARIQRQASRSESGAGRLLHTRREVDRALLSRATEGLPLLSGKPIRIRFRAELTVSNGKLLSRKGLGTSVHAASFLLDRVMVLDEELRSDFLELRRILIHELFHFVWRRLGNPVRLEWYTLIAAECEANVPGELGWSAEWRKHSLLPGDSRNRTTRWRHYISESFCDTAAWMLCNVRHEEHTLPAAFRRQRKRWFLTLLASASLSV